MPSVVGRYTRAASRAVASEMAPDACLVPGGAISLEVARQVAGDKGLSATSAYDLVEHSYVTNGMDNQTVSKLQRLANASQHPGAFRLAPHLVPNCNHTLFYGPHIRTAIPALGSNMEYGKTPFFRSISHYCQTRLRVNWPACPKRPLGVPPLRRSQIYFAVMTTTRLLPSRGAVLAYALRQQHARFGIFSDVSKPGVHELPISGALERIIKSSRSLRVSKVSFVAQKQLELLQTLANLSATQRHSDGDHEARTRWWVICDDDSFVFVSRLLTVLDLIDDRQPILAGGAKSRAHLCHDGMCDVRNFSNHHGFVPVVYSFAGGPSYVVSDRALRLIGRAIQQGRCLDASLTDVTTAACARVAKVANMLMLPGAWMVNDRAVEGPNARMLLRLLTGHRLDSRALAQRAWWGRRRKR